MADVRDALKIVLEIYEEVIAAQRRPGLDKAGLELLEDTEIVLESLHNRIVVAYNKAAIARILEDAKALGKLVKKMKDEVKGLKKVARSVERAADAARLAATLLETAAKLAAL